MAHEPHPAVLLNRWWELVDANAEIAPLLDGVDPALLEPPVNVLRLSLHPRGLAPRITNLGRWRGAPPRAARTSASTALPIRNWSSWSRSWPATPAARPRPRRPTDVVLPLRLASPNGELSFFSIAAHVGTATDVTVEELTLEASTRPTRRRLPS